MREYQSTAEAERHVLSAIVNRTILPSETGLTAADFESADHAEIFEAAVQMERRQVKIDLVTLIEAAGHDNLIIDLSYRIGGDIHHLAKEHAKAVRQNALRRAVSRVLTDTAKAMSDPQATVSGVCLAACDQLKEIIAGNATAETKTMDLIVAELIAAREDPDREVQRLSTGMDILDGMLGGGMKATNFVVIGARPSVGKSALLLSMALAASRSKKHVLYVSLEMSDEEDGLRALAHISGIATKRLETKERLEDRDNVRICDGLERYELQHIEHYAAAVCRVSDIRDLAVRMKTERGLDLICVDYIGLLRPEQNTGSRVNDVSQITRDLKALAMELEVVVAAAAQLNRDNTKANRRPVLSDLRESGSIEQDANIVIFVHNDGLPDAFGTQRKELIIAKNRQGSLGIIQTVYRGNVMRFDEIPERRG